MKTTQTEATKATALVLGLTGGYGLAMARELGGRGYRLRALVRDRVRGAAAATTIGAPVELIEGDALSREDLARAARGTQVIVHGINAPYHRWEPLVTRVARLIADVAAAEGATILFPGNVYAYAPAVGITEDTPVAPPTRKGELRVAVEAALSSATKRGARLIVLRGGDFFGQGGGSTWMVQLLGRAAKGGAIGYPTALSVRHQWAYLPDFARAHADLLERADELPADATFHFEGHVASGQEMVAAMREALGDSRRKLRHMPWAVFRVLGWVMPLVREVVKMRYLWDEEVIMDGGRLLATLGGRQTTPLVEALRTELAALGANGVHGATSSAVAGA